MFLILFVFTTNCGFKKRVDHHGVHLLKKKSDLIIVSETNKNDIIKILGPPSVISTFNNDLYFYIERKTTTDRIIKLGKMKYLENNVLVLEIDNRGILLDKQFFDFCCKQKIHPENESLLLHFPIRIFLYLGFFDQYLKS